MILAIADVLSEVDVAEVHADLAAATFVDGKATAGWSAKLVKANLQAADGPELERVRTLVEARLAEHAVFALACALLIASRAGSDRVSRTNRAPLRFFRYASGSAH